MTIAIVYNEPEPVVPDRHWLARSQTGEPREPVEDRAETGVLAQVADIRDALRELGFSPLLCSVSSGEELAGFLVRERPEAIFNCCESVRGNAALEMSVAALFDLLDIACTGSPALTLGIALDKGLAKALFHAAGVPTPAGVPIRVVADLDRCALPGFPLIVKPLAEDASIGIDSTSVVRDPVALRARAGFVCDTFPHGALVEEFIDGRELNVSLLAGPAGALEALPISEVVFDGLPAGMPPIVSYDAKWAVDSPAYQATPVTCPAALSEPLAERVRAAALAAARAVQLRDYGRVDLRVRSGDEAVFVLEANPNPDLSADAGFMRAARASGRTFVATIEHILSRALARARTRRIEAGIP
jgi:D-alanine-D-alanine ligase